MADLVRFDQISRHLKLIDFNVQCPGESFTRAVPLVKTRVGYRAWIRTMNNASKGRCWNISNPLSAITYKRHPSKLYSG